jgi:hypothetical protein
MDAENRIAGHIHLALAQVSELQQKILEKQRFHGYSGRARALSGTAALLAAAAMSTHWYPSNVLAKFTGWAAIFLLAAVLNYGALIYWFLFDPETKRDIRRLKPATDPLPALFVGGILTLVMGIHHQYEYLYGIWMCHFGLANIASRHVLPKRTSLLGLYYIACGTVCLLLPVSFTNPWPMGLVFFFGEWVGAIILHFDGTTEASWKQLLNKKVNPHVYEA